MVYLIYILANTFYSAIWWFLCIFGGVMESKQRQRMQLVCGKNDSTCASPWSVVYQKSEDTLCCTDEKYQRAYAILLVVGMSLGQLQVYYYLQRLLFFLLDRHLNIFLIFKDHARNFVFVSAYVSTIYVYQYLVYHTFFCSENALSCQYPPDAYDPLLRVFKTFVVFMAVFAFIEAFIVSMFLYCFFRYRYDVLLRVMENERALFFFKDVLDSTIQTRSRFDIEFTLNKTFNIRNFVQKWFNMTDDDDAFDAYIDSNTRAILSQMRCAERNKESAASIEQENSQAITMREEDGEDDSFSYARFCEIIKHMEKAGNDTQEYQKLWQLMTDHGTYDRVCYESIQSLIYNLYFLRKDLAVSIKTDLKIIKYLCSYLKLTLYPACFIATSRIWGYQNAFGDGVDLFKTYLLGLSFLVQRMIPHIQFLSVMLKDRPINIGELVARNNDVYVLKNIKILYSVLEGSDILYVDNATLLSGALVNVSRINISDAFQVNVPLHTSSEKMNEQKAIEIIQNYMQHYPRDIQENSYRCGWCDVTDASKTMSFHWRYKFKIYNRGRLTWTRTRICNFITQAMSALLADNYFDIALANGGAFNSLGESK